MREKILWWAALRLVRRDKPFVIAIGGAIAKTSTKEAVGAVMRAKFPGEVQVSYGNLNTYLGVPLTILGFKINFHDQHISWQWPFILFSAVCRSFTKCLPKYLVLEYGTDKTGDIPALVSKLRPNIALLTIAGVAHLANYESEEAISKEEGTLLEALPENGVAFINSQDPHKAEHKLRTKAKVIEIDCSLEDIAVEYAKNLGFYFDMTREEVEDALKKVTQAPHRFEHKKIGSWTVLDDTYNANPLSMKAAFGILKGISARRKVAILGDMKELGENEVALHREIGEIAHENFDYIIGVGNLAKEYHPDEWFASSDEADKIVALLQEADTILVKGSRSVRMEKIVEKMQEKNGRVN